MKWIFQKGKIIDSKCKCLSIGETIKAFSKGISIYRIDKPAKVSEGIIRRKKKGITFPFTQRGKAKKKVKFVPASGAATRMFGVIQISCFR